MHAALHAWDLMHRAAMHLGMQSYLRLHQSEQEQLLVSTLHAPQIAWQL